MFTIAALPLDVLLAICEEADKPFTLRATARFLRNLLTAARPELTYIVGESLRGEKSKFHLAAGNEPSKVAAVVANLVKLSGDFTLIRIRLSDMVVSPYVDIRPALGPRLRHLCLKRMMMYGISLASALMVCSNLRELVLWDSPIHYLELRHLGEALPRSLTGLTMRGVHIPDRHQSVMTEFANNLAQLTELRFLDLSNTEFKQCAPLGDALRELTNLTHFVCNNPDLDITGFEQLLNGVANCTNLRILNIKMDGVDQDELGPEAKAELLDRMRQIVTTLSTRFLNIRNLSISGIPLEHHILDLQIHFPHMKELKLENCLIEDEGLTALLSGIAACNHLKKLDLGYNYITDEGLETLVTFAERHPRLEVVVVDGNDDLTIPTLRRVGYSLMNFGVGLSCDYHESSDTLPYDAAD